MKPHHGPRLVALAAALGAALVAAGCSGKTTPTEVPAYQGPTPLPVKSWTGTFTGVSVTCTSTASVSYDEGGPLPTQAVVGCLNGGSRILLSLSREGTTLTGYAMWGDPEFYPITGMLTPTAMEITIFSDSSILDSSPINAIGTLRLHP